MKYVSLLLLNDLLWSKVRDFFFFVVFASLSFYSVELASWPYVWSTNSKNIWIDKICFFFTCCLRSIVVSNFLIEFSNVEIGFRAREWERRECRTSMLIKSWITHSIFSWLMLWIFFFDFEFDRETVEYYNPLVGWINKTGHSKHPCTNTYMHISIFRYIINIISSIKEKKKKQQQQKQPIFGLTIRFIFYFFFLLLFCEWIDETWT